MRTTTSSLPHSVDDRAAPPPPDAFVLGIVQASCGPDVDLNRRRLLAAADRSAALTWSCFRSSSAPRTSARPRTPSSGPVPGPEVDALGELASKRGVVLVTTLYEAARDGGRFNTAVVLDGGSGLVGTYRKVHVPDDTAYREAFYFDPGDGGFPVHSTRVGRIGVGICWDQWFPESARSLALRGADLVVYPTAIGWVDGEPGVGRGAERAAWTAVQRGSAVANGVHVAAANRVGRDGVIDFWGGSFVFGPMGQTLAQGGLAEDVLLAEVRRSDRDAARADWPFLAARRRGEYFD